MVQISLKTLIIPKQTASTADSDFCKDDDLNCKKHFCRMKENCSKLFSSSIGSSSTAHNNLKIQKYKLRDFLTYKSFQVGEGKS
jgi:hypothetical protein